MAKPIKSSGSQAGKRRAALTPEGRENQLIDLAVSLVEKRLLEGTASSSFCHLWDKFNPPAADHGLELIQRV